MVEEVPRSRLINYLVLGSNGPWRVLCLTEMSDKAVAEEREAVRISRCHHSKARQPEHAAAEDGQARQRGGIANKRHGRIRVGIFIRCRADQSAS